MARGLLTWLKGQIAKIPAGDAVDFDDLATQAKQAGFTNWARVTQQYIWHVKKAGLVVDGGQRGSWVRSGSVTPAKKPKTAKPKPKSAKSPYPIKTPAPVPQHVVRRRSAQVDQTPPPVPTPPAPAPVPTPTITIDVPEPKSDWYVKPGYWDLVVDAIRASEPVYLHGPTGAGKTTLPKQAALALGFQHMEVACSGGVTEDTLIGAPGIEPAGKGGGVRDVFRDGPIVEAARLAAKGKRVVLVLDEVDAALPEVLFAIHGLLANGILRVPGNGTIDTKGNLSSVATGNTLGDGDCGNHVGTRQLNVAFLNRFTGGFHLCDYLSIDDETKVLLLHQPKLPGGLADRLALYASRVRADCRREGGLRGLVEAAVSTRSLKAAAAKLVRGWTTAQVYKTCFLGRLGEEDQKWLIQKGVVL